MNIQSIKTIATEHEGSLSFVQGRDDIPFAIARIFYSYGMPKDTKRGGHAHKKMQEFLMCPHGRVLVIVHDKDGDRKYSLDAPDKGLYIPAMTWVDIFAREDNTVLVACCSTLYDESDYIRSYSDYISALHKRR